MVEHIEIIDDDIVEIHSNDETYDIIPLDSSPKIPNHAGKATKLDALSKLFDSDDDDISIVPSTRKEIIPSSSQNIEASSSIGEIRQSKFKSQPIYPILDLNQNDEVELSDLSDDDIINIQPANPKPLQTMPQFRTHDEIIKSRYLEKNNYQWPQDQSSDPIQDISFTKRSYSEAEIPDPPISRPAKKSNTTGRLTKEEKEQAKTQKLKDKLQKQKILDANRSNRKKDDLLNEMIIHLPNDLISQFQMDYEMELKPINIRKTNDSFISWSRKINAQYEPTTDSFIPIPLEQIIHEKQVVLVYTAESIISLMETEDLCAKLMEFQKTQQKFNNFTLLIIGYDAFCQKLKTQENRLYATRIRSQMNTDSQSEKTNQPKNNKKLTNLSLNYIEDYITKIQTHGFKIFPTKNNHETIQWLKSFTYTISSARYDKFERNPDLANIGTIKSGHSTQDTYLKMLLQFKFMTEIKAQRVIEVLPSVQDMFKQVKTGGLPTGKDGKKLINKNIEESVIKLFSTVNDGELIER